MQGPEQLLMSCGPHKKSLLLKGKWLDAVQDPTV